MAHSAHFVLGQTECQGKLQSCQTKILWANGKISSFDEINMAYKKMLDRQKKATTIFQFGFFERNYLATLEFLGDFASV